MIIQPYFQRDILATHLQQHTYAYVWPTTKLLQKEI